MRKIMSLLLLSIIFSTGCSNVISEQSRKLVNLDAPFKEIKAAPDTMIGKTVMLGGRIANVRNSDEGTQIEIVQFDLSSSNYPEDKFISFGRFLATDGSFMDPLIFKKGMLITLVGEIKGKKTVRLESMDYTYPVIAMREWYLWQGTETSGGAYYPTKPPQYDPYNYGYGYEPFFQRPYNDIPVLR